MRQRTVGLAISLLSLALVAGKCKGPKPPKAEAADAVEQAYGESDMAATLEEGDVTTIEIDVVVGDPLREEWATVIFEGRDGGVVATYVLDAHEYTFVMQPDGIARSGRPVP